MFWIADQKNSQSVEQAQGQIYDFFLDIVRRYQPEKALDEFKKLFIDFTAVKYLGVLEALDRIVVAYDENEFHYTLKRCCYILVNNWSVVNSQVHVQALVDLFLDPSLDKKTNSAKLKTLRLWIKNFVNSESYQTLKLFTLRQVGGASLKWSDRYTSYLLMYQCADVNSSKEQKQVADALARKIRTQFKFDLAMYTSRMRPMNRPWNSWENPTSLGNNVIQLVKTMLTKRGSLSYRALADNFIAKSSQLDCSEFKLELCAYLEFAKEDPEISEAFTIQLFEKLVDFQCQFDDRPVTPALMLRICKYVITCVTIDEKKKPAPLFSVLINQTNPLYFVVILLKLVLLCGACQSFLDVRIAELIRYYSQYSEAECRPVIYFLDMLNVAFTIYTEEIRYNLVCMNPNIKAKTNKSMTSLPLLSLGEYRIFSQVRLGDSVTS
ncbi:hypothetical protein V2H45_19340 [Tumidithrix elongata RA019]|uniref:Uncharacterized protein n=1 Tax=Tumidithrix elongata BACA0141 TaxID=2716417 RepID=A0AAW9PWR0_9CYAN|nr:hypothetical protein [Tumidithrix elongata RA019]